LYTWAKGQRSRSQGQHIINPANALYIVANEQPQELQVQFHATTICFRSVLRGSNGRTQSSKCSESHITSAIMASHSVTNTGTLNTTLKYLVLRETF